LQITAALKGAARHAEDVVAAATRGERPLTARYDGSTTQADLARRFNVSQATISRLAR
jgi:hypothetical protein